MILAASIGCRRLQPAVALRVDGAVYEPAQGIATLQPSSATAKAADLDTGQPIAALLAIEAPTQAVSIAGLTVDGSAVESSVDGCSENLVGVLYQASAGSTTAAVSLTNLQVENTTPTNSGCGEGIGIFAQAGTAGTARASLTIRGDHVSGYGKNGITCGDVGITCTVTKDTISTTATGAVAQNGVQVGFGAAGAVTDNTISGNYWTAYATDSNPQPQSDYGAGVLLYAAGINAAGATKTSTAVSGNHLSNNQIGVEVVDSAASVTGNSILEGPGIPDSIGVYGLACDAYCGYFTDNDGSALDTAASTGQRVSVDTNTINFAAPAPAGSYGIWLGDDSWTAGGGYDGPAGSETVAISDTAISNVSHLLVVDAGASFG